MCARPFAASGWAASWPRLCWTLPVQAGYDCVLLDTLDDMEAARALYDDLGFKDIPPYYHNPIPGAHYLKASSLRPAGPRQYNGVTAH
jgi:hypothetical protein